MIFQRGTPTPNGDAPAYYLTNFSRKLRENEEILVRRGRPLYSLDPPPPLTMDKIRMKRDSHARKKYSHV